MINARWARHLKGDEDKKNFLLYIMNSRALLDRLDAILSEFDEELGRDGLNEEYTSPAWPYLQADRLGQLKMISKIRKLLTQKGSEKE